MPVPVTSPVEAPNIAPAPKLRKRRFPRVIAQMAWRMRWDLLVYGLVCIVSLLPALQPRLLKLVALPTAGLSMVGVTISIFVAFRNTQAISRWWEARVLWGGAVNASRHWRDSLRILLGPEHHHQPTEGHLLGLQVLQVWLLNFELRGFWRPDLRAAVDELTGQLDLPVDIDLQQSMQARAESIAALYQQGIINNWGRDLLLRNTEVFTNLLGGMQRIRNTPLPPVYDVFIRLICWGCGYVLFMNLTAGAGITGMGLFLGFLLAERIGAYVEGPFDRDGSSFSLPLDSLCLGISRDLLGPDHPLGQLQIPQDPTLWS